MSDNVKLALAVLVLATGIGAFYYFSEVSHLARVVALLATAGGAVAIGLQTALGRTVWGFLEDSRTEVRKVVWPTRKETLQTTAIVVGMVVIMAIFLWLLDVVLLWAARLLTGYGS